MRHNCCHLSFASTLKLLNFVQAFFGISIIIYSIWMLDQYNHHVPVDPPSSSPPAAFLPDSSTSGIEIARVSEPLKTPLDFMATVALGSNGFNLRSMDLPAPWFIYSFMAVGILVCIVTFIGFIAAEAINGCCLCFYSILKTLLILLEAALIAFIAIDRQWEKDLPYDPTGELNSLRAFIEENIDICKWVGIAVVAVQLLSLLLAMVLRAMVSERTPDPDEDEDYENPRSRAWDPLLGSQGNQAPAGPSKIENWSSRIREKYHMNQNQAVNPKG